MKKVLFLLILSLSLISLRAFAFELGDRIEYSEGDSFVTGTVTNKINTQDGQEFLSVKLDGVDKKVHGPSEIFKKHTQDPTPSSSNFADIPAQLSKVDDALRYGVIPPSAECASNKVPETRFTIPMPRSYSINLMWINKTLKTDQKYISTSKDKKTLNAELIDPILKWALANPEAEVNLWYDSMHATKEQVHDTQNELSEQLEESGIKNVRLRDVREIPIVKANPDAFSDQIPIYHRVDLFKPIILVHSIESEKRDSAIFTDLEVGNQRVSKDRMGKNELFKPSVMKKVSKYGLILNKGGISEKGRAENQFLQLVDNPRMISSIKHAIINTNLARTEYALNHPDKELWVPELEAGSVYISTQQDVFNYYNSTSSGNTIKVRPDVLGLGTPSDPWIDYRPEEHGYTPFGNGFMPRMHSPFVITQDGEAERPEEVTQFAAKKVGFNSPARRVGVRNGNAHSTDWSHLIPRPPADGGNTYHVEYWK
jgi:hypothetical protein